MHVSGRQCPDLAQWCRLDVRVLMHVSVFCASHVVQRECCECR